MKKIVSMFLVVLVTALAFPVLAEGYAAAAPKADASAEDYNGKWICKYAGPADAPFDVESHLADLGMDSPMTISFSDGIAQITGIKEMEGNTFPFTFTDGAMVFSPEGEVAVFTMTLLEDGALSFTFNMVPQAAVIYLFKAEIE